MYQVNLLPWRRQRLRRRGVFWLCMFALQLVLLLLVTVAVFSLQCSRQVQRQESLESLSEALTVLTQRYQQAQQALAQFEQQKARVELQARNLQHNQRYRQFLQQLSVAVPPHCG